jgi:2-keto-4-pentenoate hydratase/2-oxohepta-3-ene-1,7-dioic acid hydratase in catechol pathway
LTGTPEGVGEIQPGQEISIEIEGIGSLTNRWRQRPIDDDSEKAEQ